MWTAYDTIFEPCGFALFYSGLKAVSFSGALESLLPPGYGTVSFSWWFDGTCYHIWI